MKWLSRLNPFAKGEERQAISLSDAIPNAANLTGVPVTERSALTLTSAYACINVIATDLASLPVRLYRVRKSGGRDEVTDHAAADRLRWSPDGEAIAFSWKQAWLAHMLGWGNGYAQIVRDGAGNLVSLNLLSPATTEAKRRESDRGLYYKREGAPPLDAADVLHLAAMGFNGITGYSPVKCAKQAIGLALAAESFGAGFYGNSAKAGGFLKLTKKLTTEAQERLKLNFTSYHGGVSNAHRIGLLEDGMDWVKTTIDPDDAQFLATRAFQVVEVCRIYRVPPHKIGDYSQAHLANVESSNLDYLVTTLRPWAVAMESVLTLKLLTTEERRSGMFFENLLTALLRGDMAARSAYYQTMFNLGAMNSNEIRSQESLNPIIGGDRYMIPANYIPLDQAGKLVIPQTTPQATAPSMEPASIGAPDVDAVAGDPTTETDVDEDVAVVEPSSPPTISGADFDGN